LVVYITVSVMHGQTNIKSVKHPRHKWRISYVRMFGSRTYTHILY